LCLLIRQNKTFQEGSSHNDDGGCYSDVTEYRSTVRCSTKCDKICSVIFTAMNPVAYHAHTITHNQEAYCQRERRVVNWLPGCQRVNYSGNFLDSIKHCCIIKFMCRRPFLACALLSLNYVLRRHLIRDPRQAIY